MTRTLFNVILISHYLIPMVISIIYVRKARKGLSLFLELFSLFFLAENVIIYIADNIFDLVIPDYHSVFWGLLPHSTIILIPVIVFAFIYFMKKGTVWGCSLQSTQTLWNKPFEISYGLVLISVSEDYLFMSKS